MRIQSWEQGEELLPGEMAGRWYWCVRTGRFERNRRQLKRDRRKLLDHAPRYGPGPDDIYPLPSEAAYALQSGRGVHPSAGGRGAAVAGNGGAPTAPGGIIGGVVLLDSQTLQPGPSPSSQKKEVADD